MARTVRQWDDREWMVAEIEGVGEFVLENAEDLIGEYRENVAGITLTASMRPDCATTVTLEREYCTTDRKKAMR